MMDLKLNVMYDVENFSEEELVDAIHDYYEAMEELTSAEQELFEVNRACENLVALQDIVAKHGWSTVLNDLVNNQISSESLDASCEGAFDRIKQAASNVGSKLANALKKAVNLFDIYVRRFKAAKEWLKKNKDTKSSSEALTGLDEVRVGKPGFYTKIQIIMDVLSDYTSGRGDIRKQIVKNDLRGSIYRAVTTEKSVITLGSCSNAELINLCDDVIYHLPNIKKALMAFGDDARFNKKMYNRMVKKISTLEQQKSTSLREDVERSEKIEDLKNNATLSKDDREFSIICKAFAHIALMQCKHLDAEIRKRGYKSEFTV